MTVFVYILLCLIWGSSWLGIKIGLADAPPLYSIVLRFGLSIVILSGIIAFKGYPYPKTLRHWLARAEPGLYMYAGSYAFVYFAELHIDSALASVLFGSFPFFVALLSIYFIREDRLNRLGWLGLLIGFSGVVVVSYDSFQASQDIFLGTLLLIAGALSAAYGVVLHKRKFAKENVFVSLNVQMFLGMLILLVAALIFEKWSSLDFTASLVGSLLYLAIFATIVTFVGYYWLLRNTSAVLVSMIAFVTPLVGILIGVVFFGERFTFLIGLGTALILSGIVLVVKK